MSFFVRVKRHKQTFFIDELTSSDTILTLKERLEPLINVKPENQRILKESTPSDKSNLHEKNPQTIVNANSATDKTYINIDENSVLDQLGIQNDSVLYLVYKLEANEWESVAVPNFEELDEKGKSVVS
ncbi:hypothetical protein HK099_003854 [Clydaea vesicula]|uniref:Ubiquitin-like domain-containing protein n=1 Tax=Clydaea vesicula TaxID=447962 RepID=A0AAD5U1H6_9FUNG|nr:hypothetical protein HK099_003854 [Clydaea vesicula]KAJ3383040.1 hypothetical protein HDU92_004417 [Lobulomyces angularis]